MEINLFPVWSNIFVPSYLRNHSVAHPLAALGAAARIGSSQLYCEQKWPSHILPRMVTSVLPLEWPVGGAGIPIDTYSHLSLIDSAIQLINNSQRFYTYIYIS